MVKKKKSSQFLRSCIFDALMILLQEKRYEEITVSEITSKAGVSRMTYYRTYSSKEDIVIQYFKEKIADLSEKDPLFGKRSTEIWYETLLNFVYSEQDLMTKIQRTPELSKACQTYFVDLLQYLFRKYRDLDIDDPIVLYEIIYKAGAIYFLITKWIGDGFKVTPQVLLEWIKQYEHGSSIERPQ